ncbi:MAG: hypothetical protein QOG71_3212 [Pyrinomonadaceae bacterium]|nr:hypothetical protein [Pyrinomonadaceae bacterium]
MTQTGLLPTIFESFNARALEPEQVAKTFVPPDYFDDTLKRAHTLIVGPRGSGKTTILKMLQSPAVEAWKSPIADVYRSKIDFTGVFIPADRSWSEQIGALGEDVLVWEHKRILGVAAFTTHVLRALVEAMQYKAYPPKDTSLVPHRRVELSRNSEAEIVSEIAEKWYLKINIPSLVSLKHALTTRLSNIWEISSEESLRNPEGRGERLANIKYLHLNFLYSAGLAIELFDDRTAQSQSKWGLLFDELELAPQWIREELIKSLRSVNSKLLFKLSMSPYSQDASLLHSELSATFGNDYNQVALWYAHKENGYNFCKALFESILKDYGLNPIEPTKLLGRSAFETLSEDYETSAYRPKSPLHARLLSMAEKDSSFRKFLDSKKLDLDNLHLLSEDERAAAVRKIRSLVAVRDAFRVGDNLGQNTRQQQRSRKNPTVYSGALSLFSIVEGNPRWFIGIIGKLIQDYAKDKSRIIATKQSSEVQKAANRFRAYLKTIPCPPLKKQQPPRGVLSALDLIGSFFHDVVVRQNFTADPPLTFVVDSRTDDDLIESLGRALNAGAIVYVNEPDSDIILQSLRGKRFRLSYLLAPYYKIPLILGRPTSLNFILKKEQEDIWRSENQDSLFSSVEQSDD